MGIFVAFPCCLFHRSQRVADKDGLTVNTGIFSKTIKVSVLAKTNSATWVMGLHVQAAQLRSTWRIFLQQMALPIAYKATTHNYGLTEAMQSKAFALKVYGMHTVWCTVYMTT